MAVKDSTEARKKEERQYETPPEEAHGMSFLLGRPRTIEATDIVERAGQGSGLSTVNIAGAPCHSL